MSESRSQAPWQPLTFGGAAAFARAKLGRLLLVESFFAALAAAAVMVVIHAGWSSVVEKAIHGLPDQGILSAGKLDWSGDSPAVLAENALLALVVDLEHDGGTGQVADLQIEFGRTDFRLASSAGYYVAMSYPDAWSTPFNRRALEPWWGAWKPVILVGAGVAVYLWLMLTWAGLGLIYSFAVRGIAFYSDREVGRARAWRVGAAALMPGCLLISAALALYGLQQLPLLGLLLAFALHLVLGWVYVVGAAFCLPKIQVNEKLAGNPFAQSGDAPAAQEKKKNPFTS